MTQIFLARCRGGEYEYAFDDVVHAWPTHKAAEEHCKLLTIEMEVERDIASRTQAVARAANATRPKYPREELLEYKRWPSGLRQSDITPAMREERERVAAHNAAVMTTYDEACRLWTEHDVNGAIIKQLAKEGLPASMVSKFTPTFSGKEEGTEYYVDPVEFN